MKKLIVAIVLGAVALTGLASCDKDYVRQEPTRIYRMNGIKLYSGPSENLAVGCVGIQPLYEYDETFAAESRQFYEGLDTTLVFQGHLVIRSSNMYMKWWDLLDMRISSLEVTALADYDAAHPVGSSLDDILNISYWYKRSRITKPVVGIAYGSMMLADCVPGADNIFLDYPGLTLSAAQPLPPVEVRITDAFGRDFTARSE